MATESDSLTPCGRAVYDSVQSEELGDLPCFDAVDGRGCNSTALTAGLLIANVIGAGILSTAVAISQLGWLLGTVSTLVLLAMNAHTSILMWRVCMGCPRVPHTYTGLVESVCLDMDRSRRRICVLATGFWRAIPLHTQPRQKPWDALLRCPHMLAHVDSLWV